MAKVQKPYRLLMTIFNKDESWMQLKGHQLKKRDEFLRSCLVVEIKVKIRIEELQEAVERIKDK